MCYETNHGTEVCGRRILASFYDAVRKLNPICYTNGFYFHAHSVHKTAFERSLSRILRLHTRCNGKVAAVKFALEQAMKAQRESRGIALLFLYPRRQMWWMVNATPRPLYLREKTRCLLYRRLCVTGADLDGWRKSRRNRDSFPGSFSP